MGGLAAQISAFLGFQPYSLHSLGKIPLLELSVGEDWFRPISAAFLSFLDFGDRSSVSTNPRISTVLIGVIL